jgi:excisionase family DNA binding protein
MAGGEQVEQESKNVLQEGWLTTEQAVELSGYHVEYLRSLLRKGAIEAVKLTPRVWLVNRESLEHYMKTVQMGRPRRDREQGDE